MGRRIQPRQITLDGREAVALTTDEYEQLLASRRQIGGQSARVRVLAQQAKRTERLVRELEELVGQCPAEACPADGARCEPGPSDGTRQQEAGCPRCAIAELLRRHRGVESS